MKIIHLSFSASRGGAARAAYRIHEAVLNNGNESHLFIQIPDRNGHCVNGRKGNFEIAWAYVRCYVGGLLARVLNKGDGVIYSLAMLRSNWPEIINASDAEIVHMHWVQGEMLSIEDIGRIKKPLVWTLHDMWAFCGAEHLSYDARWKYGYFRRFTSRIFDLSAWTWRRKLRNWKKPIDIVAPSRWMSICAKESYLFKTWPNHVIPNPVDTSKWKPIDMDIAREILDLPRDVKLLLFICHEGVGAVHKGYDLLEKSLEKITFSNEYRLELVVLGMSQIIENKSIPFKTHYFGYRVDTESLRLLYNSVDVLALPSRLDNLPNTGVEAHSCGTPIVAFRTCGLSDIVDHKETGYLADPFDIEDYAGGIDWILRNPNIIQVKKKARRKAVSLWSYETVGFQYSEIYKEIVASKDKSQK